MAGEGRGERFIIASHSNLNFWIRLCFVISATFTMHHLLVSHCNCSVKYIIGLIDASTSTALNNRAVQTPEYRIPADLNALYYSCCCCCAADAVMLKMRENSSCLPLSKKLKEWIQLHTYGKPLIIFMLLYVLHAHVTSK